MNYRKFSRDSPTRDGKDKKLGGILQRTVMANANNKVGFMRTSLKHELRTLKIYTIIEKPNGQGKGI